MTPPLIIADEPIDQGTDENKGRSPRTASEPMLYATLAGVAIFRSSPASSV